jgi:hypothetical protein
MITDRSGPASAARQRVVSDRVDCRPVPFDQPPLLRRLVGGDPDATIEVLAQAETTTSASVLVAAAMLTRDAHHLDRARRVAVGSRERQLVVLAETYLRGNADLLDVLVRDHLAEHPDHLLAVWIAGRPA